MLPTNVNNEFVSTVGNAPDRTCPGTSQRRLAPWQGYVVRESWARSWTRRVAEAAQASYPQERGAAYWVWSCSCRLRGRRVVYGGRGWRRGCTARRAAVGCATEEAPPIACRNYNNTVIWRDGKNRVSKTR